MFISRKLFIRMFLNTMDQLLDETGSNCLEKILCDPVLKARLVDLADRLNGVGKK